MAQKFGHVKLLTNFKSEGQLTQHSHSHIHYSLKAEQSFVLKSKTYVHSRAEYFRGLSQTICLLHIRANSIIKTYHNIPLCQIFIYEHGYSFRIGVIFCVLTSCIVVLIELWAITFYAPYLDLHLHLHQIIARHLKTRHYQFLFPIRQQPCGVYSDQIAKLPTCVCIYGRHDTDTRTKYTKL